MNDLMKFYFVVLTFCFFSLKSFAHPAPPSKVFSDCTISTPISIHVKPSNSSPSTAAQVRKLQLSTLVYFDSGTHFPQFPTIEAIWDQSGKGINPKKLTHNSRAILDNAVEKLCAAGQEYAKNLDNMTSALMHQ